MNQTNTPPLPLHDIHLPQGISWWPLAPGWWYLLGLIITLSGLVYLLRSWHRKGALRREALKNLVKIEESYKQTGDHAILAQDISVLLRRIAISNQNKTLTAGLTGEKWLQFLDANNPIIDAKSNNSFQNGVGKILITAPYMQHVDRQEVENLLELCRLWIKKSRLTPVK
ncbi:MAG: DUF4381 domain-containing protein [Magnetococcales bacterium]|nr:DUF4381 domain-containing protein [Magnetococcales bacterium]